MNKKEIKYLFLITIIFVAACIETDIYLPAFSDMMHYFSTSEEAIQSLLTLNFIGICVSGPLYGPISDAYGRKKPLMVALGLFLLGSIITVFAQTFEQMLFGRVLQGLGSGGSFTLGTAIIFDAFQKEKAVRALNQLNSIIPFIMAGAPMLGGYLNSSFGFRSNFLAIAFFVLVSVIVCLFSFEETRPKEIRAPLQAKKILADFKKAFTCLAFWQLTMIVSLIFAGYLAFLSATAVLFVVEFGISKEIFPYFQAALLFGWVAANVCMNRAVVKWGTKFVKTMGSTLLLISSIWLTCACLLTPSNAYLLTAAMVLYTLGANWICGLYFPECMEILPDIKGTTASLITSARLLITAVVVTITADYFYNGTIYPLAIGIIGIVISMLATIVLYERKAGKQIQDSATETVFVH